MEMQKTDILIVGGGPSGSICGIELKKHGLDCIIVDRKHFPRIKLCAGVLTRKSRDVLGEVLGESKTKSLIAATQCSHESHLRLWNGKNCFVDCDFSDKKMIPGKWRNDDWRFVLVDRQKFDNELLSYYKSLDGKTLEDDALRKIDFAGHNAELASGQVIHFNKLIACDGAFSHTEQLLKKFDTDFKPKKANALTFEINVDRNDLDIDGINVCFGYVPQTYAWAFAKGEKICIGFCRLPGVHINERETMRRFCNDLGLKNQDKYPLRAAMIPFDNAMPKPLWNNDIYFCGDAAGLDEAVTGEGIFYALRSGADAAESLIKHNPELYLTRNRYLQLLMHKAAKYQKLLASPRLFPLFRAFASRFQKFVGYFYLTQIDHSSLDSAMKIFRHYLFGR